jgi:hypothetical protein
MVTRVICAGEAFGDACREDPAHRAPRPWWWWLAFGLAALWVSACGWVIYRTAVGHPVLGGLHIAG